MRSRATPRCARPVDQAIILPAGLHDPDRQKTYMFKELFNKVPKILIGRNRKCNIWLRNKHVSAVHAQLVRDDAGHYLLYTALTTNGLSVNGGRVAGPHPVVLEAYSTISLGQEAVLEVCDEEELLKIAATTEPRYHQEAAKAYGNNELAGKKILRGRETVRRKATESNDADYQAWKAKHVKAGKTARKVKAARQGKTARKTRQGKTARKPKGKRR